MADRPSNHEDNAANGGITLELPEAVDTANTSVPQLELPPQESSGMSGVGSDTLFGDDSLAMAQHMVKSAALESFMLALTKDYRFTEFTRDLLLTIMRVIKCEAGSIFELDQAKNELHFRAAAGRSSDKVGNLRVPMGQGIVGFVAESRQSLVVDNAQENSRHLKAIAEALDFPCTSIVALPILVRGKLYGVLELLNRLGEKTFSAQDVEMLTYLCQMAAKAIEIRLMIGWAAKTARKEAA